MSGSGQLPRDEAAAGAGEGATAGTPQAGSNASAAADTRPGGGLGTPLDPEGTNDPWAKYKWWIIGGLGLVMAAGAGVMLKNGVPRRPLDWWLRRLSRSRAQPHCSFLKEGLFARDGPAESAG